MDYKLTEAEKQTMDLLREKGEVFGFQVLEKDSGSDQANFMWCDCSTLTGRWYSDEAAHALMSRRAWKQLREQERRMKAEVRMETIGGRIMISHKYQQSDWSELSMADDELAALIAAIGDKNDER